MMRIRFDQAPIGEGAALFDRPRSMISALEAGEVPAALAALDAARADGQWVAGYASYELGYVLEPRLAPLMPEGRRLPLLHFGVYDAPEAAVGLTQASARLGDLVPRRSRDGHLAAVAQVRDFIAAGDIYQANLTFPLGLAAEGSPSAIYAALAAAQPVGHGALIEQAGLPAILSRSPELFFATDADRRIVTRPMKGTMPRGATPQEDEANRLFLASDAKNRAENLMIVDLLRNDLSRVAEVGSVKVPRLYEVESYATVHQMVSEVEGRLRLGTGLAEIFAALFPGGSITGAPKVRAMEIIRELEAAPREIYCGTIGWAAPDGRASFNVAIRTILLEEDGTARLDVGGGIVWDSTPEAEYEEALWKTRFARI
jgi:para-aminobenzoate synthetase component 1